MLVERLYACTNRDAEQSMYVISTVTVLLFCQSAMSSGRLTRKQNFQRGLDVLYLVTTAMSKGGSYCTLHAGVGSVR